MSGDAAPEISDVGARTVYASKLLPQLGLEPTLSFDYRVYVVECQGTPGSQGVFCYVGIEHKSKVGARLAQHWAGKGSFYTKERKPKALHLVWPAANTAVEGYVFMALLSTLPAGSLERLGGWTQTSTKPSPLCKQQYEEQRRLIRNLCFRCGGNHWAKDCTKAVQGIEYKCASCSERLLISSRGQSVLAGDGCVQPGAVRVMPTAVARSSTDVAPPPAQVRPSVVPVRPEVRVAKRVLAPPLDPRPSKKANTSEHAGKTVLVCGRKYTSVSWFSGRANPPPKLCNRIRDSCKAVELRGGDLRSLIQHGYAALCPKELLPGRTRLSASWSATQIKCDKSSTLEVRAASEPLDVSLRQCLFLLSDVQKAGVQQRQ